MGRYLVSTLLLTASLTAFAQADSAVARTIQTREFSLLLSEIRSDTGTGVLPPALVAEALLAGHGARREYERDILLLALLEESTDSERPRLLAVLLGASRQLHDWRLLAQLLRAAASAENTETPILARSVLDRYTGAESRSDTVLAVPAVLLAIEALVPVATSPDLETLRMIARMAEDPGVVSSARSAARGVADNLR